MVHSQTAGRSDGKRDAAHRASGATPSAVWLCATQRAGSNWPPALSPPAYGAPAPLRGHLLADDKFGSGAMGSSH